MQKQPSSLTLEPNPFEQSFASNANKSPPKHLPSTNKPIPSPSLHINGSQLPDQSFLDPKRQVNNLVLTPLPLSTGGSNNAVIGVQSPVGWMNSQGQFTPQMPNFVPMVPGKGPAQYTGQQMPYSMRQFDRMPETPQPLMMQQLNLPGIQSYAPGAPQAPQQVTPNGLLPQTSPDGTNTPAIVQQQQTPGALPLQPQQQPLQPPQPLAQQQSLAQHAPPQPSQAPHVPPAPTNTSQQPQPQVQQLQRVTRSQVPSTDEASIPSTSSSNSIQASSKLDENQQFESTESAKRKQSLERNRIAAIRCRQRKKLFVDDLKHKVDAYSRINEGLQLKCQKMKQEMAQLSQFILSCHDIRTLPNDVASLVQENLQPDVKNEGINSNLFDVSNS